MAGEAASVVGLGNMGGVPGVRLTRADPVDAFDLKAARAAEGIALDDLCELLEQDDATLWEESR
jgi:hypothetical protein